MSAAKSRRRKWLRGAGLIIGLVAGAGITLLCIPILVVVLAFARGVSSMGVEVTGTEILYMILLFVTGPIMICSVVLAWKRSFIGGIVLIVLGLAAALVGLGVAYILFLLVGLPLLASGVLFILSWREEG